MTSKRKFYRTIIRYEILSEEPLGSLSLEDIHYECTEGHCSGVFLPAERDNQEVDGAEMAIMLIEQGSDPEFFQLDEDGNDVDED